MSTMLWGAVSREGYALYEDIWEISVPSVQLDCERKTALKKSLFFFKWLWGPPKILRKRTICFVFKKVTQVILIQQPGLGTTGSKELPTLAICVLSLCRISLNVYVYSCNNSIDTILSSDFFKPSINIQL